MRSLPYALLVIAGWAAAVLAVFLDHPWFAMLLLLVVCGLQVVATASTKRRAA